MIFGPLDATWGLRGLRRFLPVVAGFDGLNGVSQRSFQGALAHGPDHGLKHPSLEVLALAHHDGVHAGRTVGLPGEGVSVARVSSHTLESVVVMMTRLGSDQS